MVAHLEEQQELDDFKYFWKNWGHWLFALLITATLGHLGYIVYKDHKISQNRETAEMLAQMVDRARSKADPKQINADLLKLQQDYLNTVPTAQATMMVAAAELDTGRYDTVAGHLNWVSSNQRAPLIQVLAAQHLAVVLLQQKKYGAAIIVLNTKVKADFEPLFLEARGDVYATQNKTKEATQSYQQALEKLPKNAIERELLQMKLDSQK